MALTTIDQLLGHWAYIHAIVKPIELEGEYDTALARYEELFVKHQANPDDAALSGLLESIGDRIFEYEAAYYDIPDATPAQVLAYLMDAKELTQTELAESVQIDQGTISKLLNGARDFSKAQAKKMSIYFSVPMEVFV